MRTTIDKKLCWIASAAVAGADADGDYGVRPSFAQQGGEADPKETLALLSTW
ncbi:hypothetical protein [Arthrobacter sp. MDT1-65]